MAAQVLSFFQRSPRHTPQPADWTQQELAEFYRVESALIRAGIRVGTDRGLSDENEPWFIFYRADDGEVVIHFARIDGEYLIAGPAYEEIARGFDFSALVRNMVARHPLIRRAENNTNLSIHPAALLVAVVGTAFFKTGEARAAESGQSNAQSGHARPVLLSSSSNAGLSSGVAPIAFQQLAYDSVQIPANQAVLILAAALLASDYRVDAGSLDPAASAAIASAAASLDFSGVTPSTGILSGETATPLANHTHFAAVDNSAANTVPSVLSLIALLSTMPKPAGDTAEAKAEDVVQLSTAAHHDPKLPPLPAAENSNWALDVRVNWGAGLSIEAVQLVRGVLGDASYQKITVIEVTKLPDVLANIIAKSDHYEAASPLAPPQHGGPTLDEPTTPASSDNASTELTPNTPPVVSDTTTPGNPTPPVFHGFMPQELVREFIDYFIAHTADIGLATVGLQAVIYDTRTMHDPGAIHHLTSVTIDFFDGSSVSLIGDISSFLNHGNLV
jgi:hypothetical protein